MGEAILAVVHLKAGGAVTPEALIEFCTGKIAGYKKPKMVILSERELPRNALGKVLRKGLREKMISMIQDRGQSIEEIAGILSGGNG